jgi:hypothetical protein
MIGEQELLVLSSWLAVVGSVEEDWLTWLPGQNSFPPPLGAEKLRERRRAVGVKPIGKMRVPALERAAEELAEHVQELSLASQEAAAQFQ